jgi:acyl-CoA thioester hydrolase
MSNLIETYRGTVYPWHCDHMGHMNVMWYTGKFDEATWNLLSQVGASAAFLKRHHLGTVALEQRTAYMAELLAGEVVLVRSGVLEVSDKIFRFVHEMVNADTGKTAAITAFTAITIDTDERKSRPIPVEIAERLRLHLIDFSLPWQG